MRSYNALAALIEIIFSIVEFFLGLRILLRLLGANPASPFTTWVYSTSDSLLAPFAGIFPATIVSGHFVVDFSALFALIIYSLIGYFLLSLMASSTQHIHFTDIQ